MGGETIGLTNTVEGKSATLLIMTFAYRSTCSLLHGKLFQNDVIIHKEKALCFTWG